MGEWQEASAVLSIIDQTREISLVFGMAHQPASRFALPRPAITANPMLMM